MTTEVKEVDIYVKNDDGSISIVKKIAKVITIKAGMSQEDFPNILKGESL
jgi:hypothetical protein